MLGTSTTQIRAMAARGDLVCTVQRRPKRQRWLISLASVQRHLEERGRFDDRRAARQAEQADTEELKRQLMDVRQRLGQSEAERSRLSEEVEKFREAALRLRARNEAMNRADELSARGEQLALELAKVKAEEAAEVRRALAHLDDAIGVFLIPEPPA